ncbi:hypothetical protein F4553_006830 [Allocatelliglobosispora scoriae]|uniref:VWFD domain-containing protein n=1 Tax=Allocatelliglobosispora scoriae TaxID=643052 RepID=A0A841C0L9_9ACTN|nr:VWD domain-containing protein [Allocatelliglobosispora scoriae]MBB5873396.1 hypothetical protein [Allocatelliglobosispora scoriae]
MRLLLRGALVAVVMVISLFSAGAPASAVDGGVEVAFTGADALNPLMRLTNTSGTPCQVVAGSFGTVALSTVEQGGAPSIPVGLRMAFLDDPAIALRKQLRTLLPGESVEVPLETVDWGESGHSVRTVAWTPGGGSFAQLYQVRSREPLTLAGRYVPPALRVTGPQLCQPAGGEFGVAAAIGGDAASTGSPWLPVGLGALAALLLVVVVVLLRKRRTGTAAMALLLLAGLIGADWHSPPASAAPFVVADDLKAEWNKCLAEFQLPGHDPAGIMPTILGPDLQIDVARGHSTPNHSADDEGAISSRHVLITWDPDEKYEYVGKGGRSEKCDSLYHELYHAYEHKKMILSDLQCVTREEGATGISVAEVNATRAQNRHRKVVGLDERDHYGDRVLPKGECLPPPDSSCGDVERFRRIRSRGLDAVEGQHPADAATTCATTSGDPHLATFDGTRYDFQAAGEFILARDSDGAFEVQTRQQGYASMRTIAVNTAVAMRIAGDVVEFRRDPADRGAALQLLVGRVPQPLTSARLPGGGEILVDAESTTSYVVWPDGSSVSVTSYNGTQLTIGVAPAATLAGKLHGLLGDMDGVALNDLRPRGGEPITNATFDALYPGYADSWRVDAATSLFAYPPGVGPATFADRAFPDRPVAVAGLPGRAMAEQLCAMYGVTDPQVLAACVLDVALTGRPEFAAAAAASQLQLSGRATSGTSWSVRIGSPGEKARVEFAGTARQKVSVEITTTLPEQCTPFRLLDPSGAVLRTSCAGPTSNFLDGTVLPVDGTYAVLVDPNDTAADVGDVTLRLITVTDQRSAIEVDGAPVTARVDQPGAVAVLTFAGRSGQRVAVELSGATLPDECNHVGLWDSAMKLVAQACVSGGKGEIAATTLAVDGTYSVIVDPAGRKTGSITVRVHG